MPVIALPQTLPPESRTLSLLTSTTHPSSALIFKDELVEEKDLIMKYLL